MNDWQPRDTEDDDWPAPDGPPTAARDEQVMALVTDAWEAGQRRDPFEEPY